MLAEVRPDIVSVCLWPAMHLQAVKDCVDAGVRAVHCEKPMAPTWGESREIADSAASHGVQLTFNHQRRFEPAYMKAGELVSGGSLGRFRLIEAFSPDHLLDCGSHLIDNMMMFNGDTPVKWVIGQIDPRVIKKWFQVPFEFMAMGMIRWSNGVTGYIHSGNDKEMNWGVRLSCTRGMVEVNGVDGARLFSQEFGRDADPVEIMAPMAKEEAWEKIMPGVMKDITDGLDGNHAPKLRAENALRATEVIFAIYESSRSRARIDLPLQSKDSALISMLADGTIGPTRV